MGLMGVIATVAMLFAAFTAAMLVRRTGTDWEPVTLPRIVWLNVVTLVVSSVALELARRAMVTGSEATTRWMSGAASLGMLFLVGQTMAWLQLAARGVFLPSSPHASFFYMLSAVHGAHVIGGVGALGWAVRRTRQGWFTRTHHGGMTHISVYWHFVGVVWLYLLVMLSIL